MLEQQVRRMLADKRSAALVDNFAEQWLYLRNLAAVAPDPKLFPDFDDNLRQAFRRETSLFFESIKNEDRSVLDLLERRITRSSTSDWRTTTAFRMCTAPDFRRVTLPEDSPRGGLLGQASILDGDLVRQPDVACAAREVGAGEPARHAATSASAERAAAEGEHARAAGRCCRFGSEWWNIARTRSAPPATR